jgi:tetratricopeptide (TPR) repeat protein
MKKLFLTLLVMFSCLTISAQSDKEQARTKLREAIKLMDNGSIDASIAILEECKKLDPDSFIYSYEIAFAHLKKEDYDGAIKILKKTLKYDDINSQVYQMLGNAYSYAGKPKKAIKTYEKGMEKFPEAGNLHLEKGNVYWYQEEYNKAAESYREGIKVDPMFASNYYRLSLLFLSTSDKLSGLIYGEIFMNLERSTERTKKMSKLLYETYKNSITLKDDGGEIDFCEIVITLEEIEKGDLKLPLCAIFGKHFILGLTGVEEINATSVARIRKVFIEQFFKEDYRQYSNVLFDYHKKLLDDNLFEAYTHYIFQIGDPHSYDEWSSSHQKEIDAFFEWYVNKDNYMNVTQENIFLN